MFAMRHNICLSIDSTEYLLSWPDRRSIAHGEQNVGLKETVLPGGVPGIVELLPRVFIFYRVWIVEVALSELLKVFGCEPPRTPHQILCTVVEPIAIKIHRTIECFVRPELQEGVSNQETDRSLVLDVIFGEAHMYHSGLIHQHRHEPT